MSGRKCCVIGCDKPAEWEIYDHPYGIDDNTEACTVHVGELLTDAPEHKIFPITVAGEVPA